MSALIEHVYKHDEKCLCVIMDNDTPILCDCGQREAVLGLLELWGEIEDLREQLEVCKGGKMVVDMLQSENERLKEQVHILSVNNIEVNNSADFIDVEVERLKGDKKALIAAVNKALEVWGSVMYPMTTEMLQATLKEHGKE